MFAFPDPFAALSQLFPPKPKFTEKSLPDLNGKVYLITGASGGLGKLLAAMLYAQNAKIYVAARSEDKAQAAISEIQSSHKDSKGSLHFLKLDLGDLTTIKASVEDFLGREDKLHVLFNNAGVLMPAGKDKTEQGYEIHLGVNDVGPFLFTKLLTPILASTAKAEEVNLEKGTSAGSVRVVWTSSSAGEAPFTPKTFPIDNLDYKVEKGPWHKYGVSKAGNYLHSTEFARRHKDDGIVSVALNPGNLKSDLWRTKGRLFMAFFGTLFFHDPVNGAYTELFAGLSPEVTLEKSGGWVGPFGRFLSIRKELQNAAKTEEEGGTGIAAKFWEWSEEQVKLYA